MTMELAELRDSVRRVLEAGGLAAAPEETWLQFVELGWLWVAVPEALDGLGASIVGICVLQQELGRCLVAAPCLPALLAIDALCQTDAINRREWIERMAGGELVSAPLASCDVHYEQERLYGRITAVPAAGQATHVLAWTTSPVVIGLLDIEATGIRRVEHHGWDETRSLWDLHLTGVTPDAFDVLAEGERAQQLRAHFLNQRDFALAAESIGSANALLERTIEHLQARVQFGRPLALFQALKHRCADMKAALVAADAMLTAALQRADGAPEATSVRAQAMGAKLLATTTFARVAEDCLQLHGGIGMASEHCCHLFLKRALLNQHLAANGNIYAAEIAADFLSKTVSLSR